MLVVLFVRCVAYVDGACEPVNPGGVGGYGFVIYAEGRAVAEGLGVACCCTALCTNNVAEYKAVIAALRRAAELGCRSVKIRSDSQLVVYQLTGVYRVHAPHLAELLEEVKRATSQFAEFSAEWVPRERNKRADRLSKLAICRHIRDDEEARRLFGDALATERQIAYLKALGVEPGDCLLKREASELISKAQRRRRQTLG
ncbi:ribonuclease H [Pyrobaculum arsenaticum DSM 13514]|uniref:Ribonuclease H n=1 Tax=Pyrobaculum arsenaticum (strain DSM 13514 / JCM 11321 / PZ6) TaxID=340102 RepID=A4WHL9_PYRAR|nr:ribonuclease H [Pyrobaculum arsenaticum DSM 13514]